MDVGERVCTRLEENQDREFFFKISKRGDGCFYAAREYLMAQEYIDDLWLRCYLPQNPPACCWAFSRLATPL